MLSAPGNSPRPLDHKNVTYRQLYFYSGLYMPEYASHIIRENLSINLATLSYFER